MSAVDEIQEAIDNLTDLRLRTSGIWSWRVSETRHRAVIESPDGVVAKLGDDDTAELIVTLHRTIDAQLTTMRDAVAEFTIWDPAYEHQWLESNMPALTLARAINGGA